MQMVGVFLFVLPEQVRTLKTINAICTIDWRVNFSMRFFVIALTHKKAHILVGWCY
jgi:hypothetical protein